MRELLDVIELGIECNYENSLNRREKTACVQERVDCMTKY